ncbi:MAG: hypothetical protein ABSH08_00035 [Tepidisphaeraceae bacterium]|jgi:hypothetical protein
MGALADSEVRRISRSMVSGRERYTNSNVFLIFADGMLPGVSGARSALRISLTAVGA